MAGITHSWNGTVLTITSDSGTSSADLKGEKGDRGIRGAQGVRGLSGLSADAEVDVDAFELKENKVTVIDETATNEEYPSALAVYSTLGDIETALDNIIAIQEAFINGGAVA